MDNVNVLIAQQATQPWYEAQRKHRFVTHCPLYMFATAGLHGLHHRSACGHYECAMAIGDQRRTDIHRTLLDPTTAQ